MHLIATLRLALRLLWRDARAGEQRLLAAAAVIVAVASATAVIELTNGTTQACT